MSIAIDTNILVRILVQDPTAPDQCSAAQRLVNEATAAGEPLLVSLCALLETEWVLRSRYRVSRKSMVAAFIAMLETPGIEFEHDATVEEALYLLDQFPASPSDTPGPFAFRDLRRCCRSPASWRTSAIRWCSRRW